MKLNKVFVITFLLVVCSLPMLAQLNAEYALWENGIGKARWFTYHLEPEDVTRLKAKWKVIENSITERPNEFAAPYFQYGFMSGYFLIVSPENGYVYVRYFDVEHPCYFSYGTSKRIGDEIAFKVEYETPSRCPGDVKTPLRWIPAGGGKYLIPAAEAKRFAEFYAGTGEFNGFFIKWSEDFPFARRWEKGFVARSDSVLPDSFKHLVKKPIHANVTWVGR